MAAQGSFKSISTQFTRLFFFFDDEQEGCNDDVLDQYIRHAKQVD